MHWDAILGAKLRKKYNNPTGFTLFNTCLDEKLPFWACC